MQLNRRKWIALSALLSLSITYGANTASGSDIQTSGWKIVGNLGSGNSAGSFWWNGGIKEGSYHYPTPLPNGNYLFTTCRDFKEYSCSIQDFVKKLKSSSGSSGISASTFLPFCNGKVNISCFNELSLTNSSTQVISKANFQGYIFEDKSIEELKNIGVPNLGSSSLWTIDPAITEHHQGRVLVVPSATQSLTLGGNWDVQNLTLEIIPFYAIKFSELPIYVPTKDLPASLKQYDTIKVVDGHACPRSALWADDNNCYLRDSFSEGELVSANIFLPKSFPLRFSGRIGEPIFTSNQGGSFQNIRISGYPSMVPAIILNKWRDANQLYVLNGESYQDIASARLKFEQLRKASEDKASLEEQVWRVDSSSSIRVPTSARSDLRNKVSNCLSVFNRSKVGLESYVTSNALMGQSTPPTFDGKRISYLLAGMHFASDGSVQRGDYQVVLNAKLARCVYGISGAMKAEINVIDDGGSQQIFTQSFTEKDGLLNLRISGFHFSNPIISFALTSGK